MDIAVGLSLLCLGALVGLAALGILFFAFGAAQRRDYNDHDRP